jgi:hypothetical protein
LRAKTDVDLARYATNELNLGLRLVSEPDDESRIRAEEIYDDIVRLVPVIHDLDAAEDRRLHARLKRLRTALDHLPALARSAR